VTKFNALETINQQLEGNSAATTNYEGGFSFKVSSEMDLYLRACTSLLDDKYYVKSDQHLEETRALIHQCSRKFVLQLAGPNTSKR